MNRGRDRMDVKRAMATIVSLVVVILLVLANLPGNLFAANETVEVWLTLADESKKLNREADLTFSPGSGSAPYTIHVDENTTYQQMEGFGAAVTDSSAWLIWTKLSEPARNELMANLFTREGDGIGLSYVRVPMGASDFALYSYTYDDLDSGVDPDLLYFSTDHDDPYIIPVLQQAKALNPQLRFMGTPWSAPAWMKLSKKLNSGELRPEYFQAFADYHVKFVEEYTAKGIPIDTLTPQNEPLHQTNKYPSMYMEAADQLAFVRDNLGPALATAGLDTRIVIYDHNWDVTDYALTILNDPVAKSYVDGTAFHCYAGDVANQSTVHNAHPDKSIWFTECSGGDWSTDFGDNVSWNMHNLVVGNMRNWGNSFIYWNIALDENDGPQNGGCDDCRGVVTIYQSTGAVEYNEEYYILGHLSKFVDPGSHRIDSTNYTTGQPENVAFQNPDGSIALIVHSTAATTFDVQWGDQYFTYSLPEKGTATFTWGGSPPEPTATPTEGPSPTPEPTSTPTPTSTPNTMHVSNIAMSLLQNGSRYKARAIVTIKDGSNAPVDAATVWGEFTGATSSYFSRTTDSSGVASFDSGKATDGGWTFCVDDIVKAGWTYDPDANVEICDSISIP